MTARLPSFGLARDQMRSALASGAGISPADLDALEHLEAAGSLTQRELGTRLALTSGAITMLVDRIKAIAAGVPAVHEEAVATFLAAAADAAAEAASQLRR